MPRIESLSILLDPTGQMYLRELYAGLIENVSKGTLSARIKNTELSGNPEAGTVEAKRFANATSQEYGTARAAGAGNKVKGKPVTIPIDKYREFVEEIEEKDVSLLGVDGLLAKRAANHQLRMIAELDQAFFAQMIAEGNAFQPKKTEIQDQIEELILHLETLQNDYIDGIPREMIYVICSPTKYSAMRKYFDTVVNTATDVEAAEFGTFHGVRVWSSMKLPAGVDFVTSIDGSCAQPVRPRPYNAEKIPLSEAYGVMLFYYYGTKVVTPDAIFYVRHAQGVTATSAAGATTGTTKLTVTAPASLATGQTYVYKVADAATDVLVGEDLSTWTAWDGSADITAATNKILTLVVVDAAKVAVLAGNVKVVAKA